MPEIAERSTVEILRAARERITPVEAWTQDRLSDAITVLGDFELAKPALLKGTCWCASGAMLCEAPTYFAFQLAAELLIRAAGDEELAEEGITSFNDSHTHLDVLAAFDNAIPVAEQEATNA